MTHQDNSHLEIEDRGATLIVRVDGGPHSLFGVDIANELDELVDRVDRDPNVHAVVFTGARPGRFVSHADVRWLQAEGAAVPDLNRRGASAVLRLARGVDRARVPEPVLRRTPLRGAAQLDRLHATFLRMNASGVIFVAALNGSALGLGAEFAWACDLRVMADGEFFIGQPEVLLGIMPGGGGSQRLTRLIGTHKSLVAILEGKPFTPAQALANGAVDDVVAPDEVVTRAAELADYFGKRTKGSVEAIKRSVYFGGSMSLSEGLHVERTEFLQTDQSEDGSGTDAPVPFGYGVHRRAAPLPPGHLRASARIGPGARGRLDQRCGEPVMSTAQPYHPSRRLVHLRRGHLCRMALPAHRSHLAARGHPRARPRRDTRDAPGRLRRAVRAGRYRRVGLHLSALRRQRRPASAAAVDQATARRLGCRHRMGEESSRRRRHTNCRLGKLLWRRALHHRRLTPSGTESGGRPMPIHRRPSLSARAGPG